MLLASREPLSNGKVLGLDIRVGEGEGSPFKTWGRGPAGNAESGGRENVSGGGEERSCVLEAALSPSVAGRQRSSFKREAVRARNV